MRIKSLVAAVACLAVIALGTPANSAVATSAGSSQVGQVFWSQSIPNGWINGDIIFERVAGASTLDAAVTPTVDARAAGAIYTQIFNPCCSVTVETIPLQTVSPTAVSADPIGNSMSFTAVLNGTNGAYPVSLSMVRPQSLSPTYCSGCANAWFDPGSNDLRISVYQPTAIYRSGYQVTGSVGPYSLTGNSYWGQSSHALTVSAVAATN